MPSEFKIRTDSLIEHLAHTRSSLIIVLTAFGSLTTLFFCVNSFINGHVALGFQLMCVPVIGSINLIVLYTTKNTRIAAHLLSFLTLILTVILVSGGGVENSGPLWIYPILTIALLIHTARNALTHTIIFVSTISLLLYTPNNPLLTVEYSSVMANRIISTSLVLAIMLVIVIKIQEHYQQTIMRMNAKLEHLANTDNLTKVHNRNYIYKHFINDQRFTDLIADQSALLLLDIDHFKRINDTYGHDVGDIVLQRISDEIAANIRAQDVFARWGGEEFILILNNTSKEIAEVRGEHIRQKVAELMIKVEQHRIQVTTSLGLAMLAEDKNANKTIKAADKNLYQAKASGRNKLVA